MVSLVPSSIWVALSFCIATYAHYTPARRGLAVPQIGGSEAGFIGLVVALGVLIVVCCSAVFCLLRYHEPSDQERSLRGERYRRHRAEQDAGPAQTPLSVTSIGEKFKRAWSRIRYGSRRGGRGWIQAGSGDEWESDSGRGDSARNGVKATQGPIQSLAENDVGDAVRIVESPLSGSNASGFISAQYSDPFKESPISQMSPIHVDAVCPQSPLVMNPSGESGGAEERKTRDHNRHLSSLSTASGTRFVEHI